MEVLKEENIFSKFEPIKKNRFIAKFKEGGMFSRIPSYCIKYVSPIEYHSNLEKSYLIFELYNIVDISIPEIITQDIKEIKKYQGKINPVIDHISPVGDVLYSWDIKGEINYINFGELSWSSIDDISEITICMTYDMRDLVFTK